MATITLPAGSSSNDLQEAINEAASGDIIELSGDMNFLGTVTIPQQLSVVIQSTAGNTWTMTQTLTERHFFVLGELTLSDIVVSGTAAARETVTIGGLEVSGSLNLLDGAVVQACCSRFGGGVNLAGAALGVQGGTITNNFSELGAGVYAVDGSTINMNGGAIRINSAQLGGGVHVSANSVFHFNSGTIESNVAQDQGGGIDVDGGGALYMINGVITSNHVTFDSGRGAGVCVSADGSFEMSGGQITRNTLNLMGAQGGVGGGVCVRGGQFEMADGAISYNQSIQYGAGVAVTADGTFTMSGGSITHNTAEIAGGGEKLNGGGAAIINGTFNMNDGVISHNEAMFGGGVYLGYNGRTVCRLNMEGGTIEDNYARFYGGGIHTQYEASSIGIGGASDLENPPAIRSNKSGFRGGGISIYLSSADIYTCQVGENSAAYGGGIYASNGSVCRLDNVAIKANEADFEGGGIFTDDYDYSDPASLSAYQTILTSANVVFNGNRAVEAYAPPQNAEDFTNIGYLSTSIAGTSGYLHPLNNYDINYAGTRVLTFYNVTYDANGGTGSFISANLIAGTVYAVLSPEEVEIDRSSYIFAGWNTEPDGGGTYYEPGDTFAIVENVVLYAQWTSIEGPYDVIYDANGGIGSHGDTDIPSGTSYTVLSLEGAGISRAGYAFVGWNTESDGNGTAYQPGDIIVITGNLILYAQWEQIGGTHQILYCPNCPCCCAGYNSICCTVMGVARNTVYTILSQQQAGICCPCHIFISWNTWPDGRGIAYQPGHNIVITGDVVLYGQWMPCRMLCGW